MTQDRKAKSDHARDCNAFYTKGGGTSATVHHRLVMQSSWRFREQKVSKILDVGCGRGKLLEELGVHGYELTGTEICRSLLEKDLKRFSVYPYFISDLGIFLENDFDLVMGVDLLPHLRDELEVDEFLIQAHRIAAKGVLISVCETDKEKNIHAPNSFWRGKASGLLSEDMYLEELYDKKKKAARFLFWRADK